MKSILQAIFWKPGTKVEPPPSVPWQPVIPIVQVVTEDDKIRALKQEVLMAQQQRDAALRLGQNRTEELQAAIDAVVTERDTIATFKLACWCSYAHHMCIDPQCRVAGCTKGVDNGYRETSWA